MTCVNTISLSVPLKNLLRHLWPQVQREAADLCTEENSRQPVRRFPVVSRDVPLEPCPPHLYLCDIGFGRAHECICVPDSSLQEDDADLHQRFCGFACPVRHAERSDHVHLLCRRLQSLRQPGEHLLWSRSFLRRLKRLPQLVGPVFCYCETFAISPLHAQVLSLPDRWLVDRRSHLRLSAVCLGRKRQSPRHEYLQVRGDLLYPGSSVRSHHLRLSRHLPHGQEVRSAWLHRFAAAANPGEASSHSSASRQVFRDRFARLPWTMVSDDLHDDLRRVGHPPAAVRRQRIAHRPGFRLAGQPLRLFLHQAWLPRSPQEFIPHKAREMQVLSTEAWEQKER